MATDFLRSIRMACFSAFSIVLVSSISSCSDSNEDASFIVNYGGNEISINRIGGSIEVPVTATGAWKVSVEEMNEDGPCWLDLDVTEGFGEGILRVDVDYLSPKAQKHERKAALVLENGDKRQVVQIRQYIGLQDGETANNSSTEPFTDLWNSKGIGSGFDVLKGEQTTNMILNPKGLIELSKSDTQYASLFRQTTNPDAKNEVAITDTLENDTTGLKVSCIIDVKYANFKLKLEVKYNNEGEQLNNVKTYNGSQDVVFLSSAVDVSSIKAMLQDDPKFGNSATKKVVSPGFRGTYKDIMEAYNDSDEDEFEACVEDMLDYYGPVVVTGADLGGSIFISMRYDSLYVENKFNVHGKLNGGLALAAVSIEANVEADYLRHGQDIWENSQHYISASGGNKEALTALTSLMSDLAPDRDKIRDAATKWLDSIVSSNDSDDNTTVVKIRYTPIWNLFPAKVARKMKPIVAKRYKGKTICTVNPEDLGILEDNGSVGK